MILFYIVCFSMLASLFSVMLAGSILLVIDKFKNFILPCLVSFAIGTLLASGLLGMIPHASKHLSVSSVMLVLLLSIIGFFLLEKLVLLRHCHNMDCKVHKASGTLILVGDAFHNFIDGVIITVGFLISVEVGIITSLSIIAHEIPQEVGDFVILIESGFSKKKAILYNLLSGAATFPGAIGAYFLLAEIKPLMPYFMAISAGSFIYIALSDLVPELHKNIGIGYTTRQIFLLFAGCLVIYFLLQHHP